MPVSFDNSVQFDMSLPQTVEGVYRVYGNWAGVHDFEFDSLLEEASRSLTGSSAWSATHTYADPVPYEIEIDYTVDQVSGHGVLLKKQAASHWLVGVTTDHNGIVMRWNGSSYNTLMSIPLEDYGEADIRVMFRQQRFTDDPQDVWHTASMWVNDRMVLTYTEHVGSALVGDVYVGFAAQTGDREFSNIRIPQLTEFSEWSSIDPGEFPNGGLQRAIEGRYTKHFIRWNGAMRAWRPIGGPSLASLSDDNLYSRTKSMDRRTLFSHVRMLGAYEEAEFVRRDLMNIVGHRFTEASNPYLMSVEECLYQAERELYRMESSANTQTVSGPFNPLFEPEDHIEIEGEDWIIMGISWKFGPGLVEEELQLRKYISGV